MRIYERKRSAGGKRGSRGKIVVVVLVSLSLLAAYHASWVGAQARAAVVLFSVLETPVLGDAMRLVTPEPRVSDATIGGNPAYVYEPGGASGVGETHPAMVFINGTTPEGRELPAVRSLAEGLARSGFVVFVPDLPGLRGDEISPETVAAAGAAVRAAADHPGVRGDEVALVGASTGATLSLLVAADPALDGRITSVSGLAPFTDIRTALSLATTGRHAVEGGRPEPYASAPFLSYVIARSVVAALPPGEDREILSAELSRVDREAPDPLADLRRRPTGDLGRDARAVVSLLANKDPRHTDELYEDLPGAVRSDLEALSPLASEGSIEVPVQLATAPRDKYFPASESLAVSRLAPEARVTVTEALEHTEPGFDLRELPAFLALDAFVVRSLHEAWGEP